MNRTRAALNSSISLVIGARCILCGARGEPTPCSDCRWRIWSLPATTDAAYVDADPLARLVRLAKRGDWRGGGAMLARLMCARMTVTGIDGDLDAVTWVPADRRRRARRGGHLPERTARELATLLGIPALALLTRRAGDRPQRGLDRAARRENVADAFQLRPSSISALRGRPGARLLLVDDVRTTGSTLEAAGTVLERAGWAVRPLAIVGVDRVARQRRSRGPHKHARSAKNRLTIPPVDADRTRHDGERQSPD